MLKLATGRLAGRAGQLQRCKHALSFQRKIRVCLLLQTSSLMCLGLLLLGRGRPSDRVRRRSRVEDRISALPDELLHIILVRLQSAARTSVLSRRWRGVWAHMPELVLGGILASATTPSALLDSIDAALNSSAAPTLHSLEIDWQGIAGYTTFLKEMEKLPICETLVVNSMTNHHAFAPMVLHLLRRCSCIRKFKLILNRYSASELPSCTTSDCPCHLPENYSLDDIAFNSLEEIEISFFTGSAEQVEFVELLLSRCNTVTTLKKVDFTVPFVPVSSEIMEVVQSISSMCHLNSKVQFNVHAREEPEP